MLVEKRDATLVSKQVGQARMIYLSAVGIVGKFQVEIARVKILVSSEGVKP